MDKILLGIVLDLADADPEGIVDYEADYSSYTPGGPITGCRFCKRAMMGPKEDWHEKSCLWLRAQGAKASMK